MKHVDGDWATATELQRFLPRVMIVDGGAKGSAEATPAGKGFFEVVSGMTLYDYLMK